MSKKRPGSEQASQLWSSFDPEEWAFYLAHFDDAMQLTDEKKKKGGALIRLDKFVRDIYPKTVTKRGYFELADLSKIAEYKMTRGKMRPLQKKIDSNDASKVIASSKSAVSFLTQGDWENGITAVASLFAVGPATASCLLAPLFPALCPFMDDIVVESVSQKGERDTRTHLRILYA
jgi:hypothetical protein